jgi:molybdate transport system substrate-binding protein
MVFAASSLAEAFNEVKAALQAQHPGLSITYNFAGTPTLRTQIEQGAKADVFASANGPQMELAVKAGVTQGKPVLFAANRLVVVTPGNSAKVQALGDLARPGVKLVLALRDVPVGGYAREAIGRMGASGEFGADFSDKALANVVSEEPNVRQTLSKVALGEADAAIVYTTDVTPDTSLRVKQIPIEDRFNVLALYPIAMVKGAAHPTAAEHFITYLRSPDGRAILARHGFREVPQR